mgnify:CR=1 FL=1
MVFTHFHMDHLFGFPFFAPIFAPSFEITVTAPAFHPDGTRDRIARFLWRKGSGAGAVAGYLYNAISGIETALWDLVGKSYNVPCWQFLGGKVRDEVRIYVDCHAGDNTESWDTMLEAREPAWLKAALAGRVDGVLVDTSYS